MTIIITYMVINMVIIITYMVIIIHYMVKFFVSRIFLKHVFFYRALLVEQHLKTAHIAEAARRTGA